MFWNKKPQFEVRPNTLDEKVAFAIRPTLTREEQEAELRALYGVD